MGKNIGKIILENIEYEEYEKQERALGEDYYKRLCGDITTEMRNNFTKLKDIINEGGDKVEYDGFYIPQKFIDAFSNTDMRHSLNSYMDLTISDVFNMIDDNTDIEMALKQLFDEYKPDSALAWGDNFLQLLSGSLNESAPYRKEWGDIAKKIIADANEIYKGYTGEDMYYNIDSWEDDGEYTIMVDVSWGDWKHDHLALNDVFNQAFKKANIKYTEDEQVTEEDGSDTYSATHIYTFRPEEAYNADTVYSSEKNDMDFIKFICGINNIPCEDDFAKFVVEKKLEGYSGQILKDLRAEFDKKN